MSEYANYGRQRIKIGTCESMYYLRFEDRHAVRNFRKLRRVANGLAHELRAVLEAQEDRGEHKNQETGEVYDSHKFSKKVLTKGLRYLKREEVLK